VIIDARVGVQYIVCRLFVRMAGKKLADGRQPVCRREKMRHRSVRHHHRQVDIAPTIRPHVLPRAGAVKEHPAHVRIRGQQRRHLLDRFVVPIIG
jgi:hypothetical protein